MHLQHIALAGATGNLGLPTLSTLLSAGYSVTVLTRNSKKSSKITPHANLNIMSVDFTSVPSLFKALKGVIVVISCLSTSAMGSQNPLIDASAAAGVKRFIPAEFGMDSQNPLAMQLPVYWSLETSLIADLVKHTATLYNGGDVPFSATILSDVAKAMLGVIENQRETANRVIYVHSALVTHNQLIRYAKDRDGREWDVVVKSTETVKQESYEELRKGVGANTGAAFLGFCIVAMFDVEYGCGFSGRLDNAVVGLLELDENEIREVVESHL